MGGLVQALLARVVGREFAGPFGLLTGGSFGGLLRRAGRLRRVAAGMLRPQEVPPLPVRLQIETTDLCNLKCRMCTREVIDGMNTMSMSYEQFEDLVRAIDPYYVTMNGLGEPLVDKTVFEKLAFLRGRRIMTAMPTNGTYIRRNKLDGLTENLPDILTFSIDGATKESFEYVRVRGDFAQIVKNYKALLERRRQGLTRQDTKVNVLCALQKANLHDYKEMYRLVQSLPGIDGFNLVPVFDYDPDGQAFAGLVPSPEDVAPLHRDLDAAIAAASDPEEADFYRNWKTVSSAWLAPAPADSTCGGSCLVPWFSTYVDAKGRVYPCCYLTNTAHVMGNINETPFEEIWAGTAYRDFRQALVKDRKTLPGCRTCPRNDDGRLARLRHIKPLLG